MRQHKLNGQSNKNQINLSVKSIFISLPVACWNRFPPGPGRQSINPQLQQVEVESGRWPVARQVNQRLCHGNGRWSCRIPCQMAWSSFAVLINVLLRNGSTNSEWRKKGAMWLGLNFPFFSCNQGAKRPCFNYSNVFVDCRILLKGIVYIFCGHSCSGVRKYGQ